MNKKEYFSYVESGNTHGHIRKIKRRIKTYLIDDKFNSLQEFFDAGRLCRTIIQKKWDTRLLYRKINKIAKIEETTTIKGRGKI